MMESQPVVAGFLLAITAIGPSYQAVGGFE